MVYYFHVIQLTLCCAPLLRLVFVSVCPSLICRRRFTVVFVTDSDADVNVFAADEIATGLLQQNTGVAGNRMTMSDFRSDVSPLPATFLRFYQNLEKYSGE